MNLGSMAYFPTRIFFQTSSLRPSVLAKEVGTAVETAMRGSNIKKSGRRRLLAVGEAT